MELWDAYDENRKPLGYTVKREKFDSLNNAEHRSMYSYVRLSIDRCTATYVLSIDRCTATYV